MTDAVFNNNNKMVFNNYFVCFSMEINITMDFETFYLRTLHKIPKYYVHAAEKYIDLLWHKYKKNKD